MTKAAWFQNRREALEALLLARYRVIQAGETPPDVGQVLTEFAHSMQGHPLHADKLEQVRQLIATIDARAQKDRS